jgi:hypothetical protein
LSVASIWSGVARGDPDRRTATAPATWGAAIDVPNRSVKRPPGTAEVIVSPGARRSTIGALFEKAVTSSGAVS